jgi:hypothetical protein
MPSTTDTKGGNVTKKIFAPSLIALLSAIRLASIASAQTNWTRTYGGTGDDEGYSVQQTTDGGYIIACGTLSDTGPTDVYLIKVSAQGDTLWTKTYGGGIGFSVQQTTDGGYVITGLTGSVGAGGIDVYLIKTTAQGDTLWTRTYGGPYDEAGYSVEQTTDGGYIIAGWTSSSGAGGEDVYLIKTNASGDTLWTRTYGGVDNDRGYSVQQTTDGYVIAGGTSSFGAGNGDVYLIKTNAQGDTLWTRTYGGANEDNGNSVQQTTDGGYFIGAYTYSFGAGDEDVYLIKTDDQGDTIWTRTFGGSGSDEARSVQQTTDGGYIIAGWFESYGAGADVYQIKTDAQGDTLWTRTYGGVRHDRGYSVRQTSDGGYIIAGYTWSFSAGGDDVYLIKTDSLGNVGVAEPLTGHPLRPTRFLVQPNPFTSFARVPGHETDVFALSDVTGRQVAVCKGDRVGEGLRPGVYFVSPVGLKTSKVVTETIIKAAF